MHDARAAPRLLRQGVIERRDLHEIGARCRDKVDGESAIHDHGHSVVADFPRPSRDRSDVLFTGNSLLREPLCDSWNARVCVSYRRRQVFCIATRGNPEAVCSILTVPMRARVKVRRWASVPAPALRGRWSTPRLMARSTNRAFRGEQQ